jgi:dipeptide/tripeptide permease
VVETAAPPEDRTNVTQFAVTNVAELLERSAYYGFVSIFGLYLDSLGYEGAAIGAVSILLLALPYVIPLLTGPIAEKVGYKPVMLVALTSYTAGFLVLSSSSAIASILVGTVLVAMGAGGFKPVATATIAHITAPRHRSLGYTVYYTGINVGGFFGPLIVALLTDSYAAGFATAAGIMLTALALTLLAYRNPQPPQRHISVGKALGKLGAIVEDPRLVLLLLIFSGFWFLYSMNFSFLALYLDRFVDLPSWFRPSLQQSFNPFIIIFLGIPIGAFATKQEPRRMMTVGVLLYVIGFTVLGFVQHVAAFFVGLSIATLGEILAYPAFLTYIAGIAPKDRIAVYQSYGFLPLFIGFFLGPLACGPLYQALAVEAGRPELFWAVPISVGVLALAAFLVSAQPREGASRRPLVARGALVLLLIPVLFSAAAFAGSQQAQEPPATNGLVARDLQDVTGTTAEGDSSLTTFSIPAEALGNVTFRLVWQDEAAQATATNQPDTLRLVVLDRQRELGRAEAANGLSGAGEATVRIASPGATTLTLQVIVVSAGDQVVAAPLAGSTTLAQDTGNDWTIETTIEVSGPASS